MISYLTVSYGDYERFIFSISYFAGVHPIVGLGGVFCLFFGQSPGAYGLFCGIEEGGAAPFRSFMMTSGSVTPVAL